MDATDQGSHGSDDNSMTSVIVTKAIDFGARPILEFLLWCLFKEVLVRSFLLFDLNPRPCLMKDTVGSK